MTAVTDPLASMLSTCTTCRSRAEQDEGPYHRDARPVRRDIVEDRDRAALLFGIRPTTLISRLYFPDDISEHVLSLSPYAGRRSPFDSPGERHR